VTPSRLGVAAVAAGLVVLVVARLATPSASPPLYDGIVPLEPYRWLNPPPGQPGGAEGATATAPVTAAQNPLIAVGTPELSPQAQVFAAPNALTLPAGASSVVVSIEPVEPPVEPAAGYIDGNVYRFTVTDQSGVPITAPASAKVTVVLRAADLRTDATIERFDGLAWRSLETSAAGAGSLISVVTEFGELAVVASGTSPYTNPSAGEPSLSILAALGVAVLAVTLVVILVGWRLVIRRRRERSRRRRPTRRR
jgi:hypothetical protein